jgi:hypothetical protein
MSKSHNQMVNQVSKTINYLNKNEFNYFIVSGKNGLCARYYRSNHRDMIDMFKKLMLDHPDAATAIKQAIQEIVEESSQKQLHLFTEQLNTTT